MINIYYQDEFCGKEIATSLSRYVRFCLDEKDTKPIELSLNSEKFLNNSEDNHILVFMNFTDDVKNWGTMLGKICKKIKEEREWKLRIIDLTWQDDFPINAAPDGAVISVNKNCSDWLTQIAIIENFETIKIKIGKEYCEKYYSSIDHGKKTVGTKNYYKYIEDIQKLIGMENLKILILEDAPQYKSDKDNIQLISTKENFDQLLDKIATDYDVAILDYDLRDFETLENGWLYMPDVLRKNSHCNIILVTSDDRIRKDIKNLDPSVRDLISERPNIRYFSRTLEPGDFKKRICQFINNVIEHKGKRAKLQKEIKDCAIKAYEEFMKTEVKKLTEKSTAKDELLDIREKEIITKEDTMKLDKITERVIENNFIISKPKIHEYEVLICTEEGGVANSLIYRLERPKFYIFSDPLDGSSAMKSWINETSIKLSPDLLKTDIPSPLYDICEIDKDSQYLIFKKSASEFTKRKDELLSLNQKEEWKQSIERLSEKICDREKKLSRYLFKDLINDNDERASWKERYGPIELNAPMISIVLAERHQVVGNVIVNLFTGDIYKSDDTGNYKSKIDPQTYTVREETWEKLRFRDFSNGSDKLFLCTLNATKYKKYVEKKKGNPQDFQFLIHFRECLQPLIPHDYDLEGSFKKREQRHDFTPGPGRILYLTEVAEKYSVRVKDDENELYSCILSSGEPLTEWVGWFAFLRHASKISAYCLRTGSGNICQHQIQRSNIKGTMMPPEVSSLFKSGMMDFEVLHTGYRGAMSNYTDSIVVFFDEDESWKRIIKRKLEDRMTEGFVRIEP